ncbi:MAG: hypothetical protein Q9181_004736 [Wetmoreana brouardii]
MKERPSLRNFSTTVRLSDGVSKPFSPQQLFPKRKGFSDNEIRAIFGKQMDPSEGNQLLHLIQEQRLAGTIDEATPGSQLQKQKALAWLRKNYPVDEDQAILNRLDREEEAALRPQGQQGQPSVYGSPAIDRIREENIARRKKREQERELEKAKEAEVEAQKLPVSTTRAVTRKRTAGMQWYEKYRKKAEEAGQKSVPQMSFMQRIGPATILTVTVVSLCVMFAQNYNPPSRAARLFPDIPPAAATVGALIGVNVVVWLAWKIPPLYRFMNRVFCLVPAYPYASSILGNNLSHQVSKHLVVNMVGLWFVGTHCKPSTQHCLISRLWLTYGTVHEEIGRGPFLAVYIVCGAAASHIFLIHTVLRKDWIVSSMGCSGALCGLLATWFCINSDKGLHIWPLPPAATELIPPLLLLSAIIAYEIWGASKFHRYRKQGLKPPNIDHISHLAGYASGIVAAQFLRLPATQKQQTRKGNIVTKPRIERVDRAT